MKTISYEVSLFIRINGALELEKFHDFFQKFFQVQSAIDCQNIDRSEKNHEIFQSPERYFYRPI